jgi:hypothetical protein
LIFALIVSISINYVIAYLLTRSIYFITLSIMKMKFLPAQMDAKVVLIAAPQANLSTSTKMMNSFSYPMENIDLNSLPLLLPEESYACTFSVSKNVGSSLRSIGVPEIKWCSYMGEHGIVKGNMVQLEYNIPSQPNIMTVTDGQIQIDCIRSPPSAVIGIDFEVTLRITNSTSKQLSLQLICRDAVRSSFSSYSALMTEVPSSSNLESLSLAAGNVGAGGRAGTQLFVTGLSKADIGILGPKLYMDIQITVCAVDLGLQELVGIVVQDTSSLKEYPPSNSLMKVMITSG